MSSGRAASLLLLAMRTLRGRWQRQAGRAEIWFRLRGGREEGRMAVKAAAPESPLLRPPAAPLPRVPDVQVGEGLEVGDGGREAAQAVVVQAQPLQGHQVAGVLGHFGKAVPRQICVGKES